jgi:hypothetical protein
VVYSITAFSRSVDYFPFSETDSGAGKHYSFYTWLFLIVFVDVAHVYSTLFKTYFVKGEVQKRKLLYIGIPLISWVLGNYFISVRRSYILVCVSTGCCFSFYPSAIWVYEDICPFEPNNWSKKIDEVAVYAATIYPMLYWFKTPRSFTWFVNNEFDWLQNLPDYTGFITVLYIGILMTWMIKRLLKLLKPKI